MKNTSEIWQHNAELIEAFREWFSNDEKKQE